MIRRYQRMTKAQLKKVVADYAAIFSGWSLFQDTAFIRTHGPIRQMVWFEALRTGDYRPRNGISAVSMPIVRMLPQMLDVRHREASVSQHEARMPGIVAAMEEQFLPDIRKTIDAGKVLALCEARAKPNSANDQAMLAILYSWLDHRQEALDCCLRMQSGQLPTIAPIPEWEQQIKAFGRDLANAIERGEARTFLAGC